MKNVPLKLSGATQADIVSRKVRDDTKNNKDMSHVRIIVPRLQLRDVQEWAYKTFGRGSDFRGEGPAYASRGRRLQCNAMYALEVVKESQDAYIHTTLIKKWDICARRQDDIPEGRHYRL